MHLKAIPAAALTVVKTHPLVIGAAVLAVTGGSLYVYQQRQAAAASNNDGGSVLTRPDPNAGIGVATTADLSGAVSDIAGIVSSAIGSTTTTGAGTGSSTSNGTIDTSNTPASSVSAGIGGGSVDLSGISSNFPTSGGGGSTSSGGSVDSFTQQLIDQNTLQINDNFTYQMAQLQLTAAISATNAFLENAAINSANYGIAAGLASAFIYSGNQASMGVITGPDGLPIIDFSMINAQNSNKNGFDANLATLINSGTFANFWNQTGVTPGATPGTGTTGAGGTMPNYFAAFLGGQSPSTGISQSTNAAASNPAPQQVNTTLQAPPANTNVNMVPAAYSTLPNISSPATASSGFQLPTIAQPSLPSSGFSFTPNTPVISYPGSNQVGRGNTAFGQVQEQ